MSRLVTLGGDLVFYLACTGIGRSRLAAVAGWYAAGHFKMTTDTEQLALVEMQDDRIASLQDLNSTGNEILTAASR